MLLCICLVTGYLITSECGENNKKKACKEQLSVIDVLTKVFYLLLNRPTVIGSLFVLYDKKAKCCQWWHHLCICHAINHRYEWIKMHVSFRKYNNFFSKPPVKNFFSTNSSRPNSSRPTPHSRTLCASSCDLTELSSVDHSLHNCHPKRRRKTTTAVCLAHKLCSSTIWSEIIVSSHDKLKALKELQRKNNKESVWTVILNWWI